VTVPYSKWRKLLFVAEGDRDFRLQEVSANGRQLVQAGKYLILPYPWKNRLNRSLAATIICFLCFIPFVRLLRKSPDSKEVSAKKSLTPSSSPYPEASIILGLFLSCLSFFGPLAISFFADVPQLENIECPRGLEPCPFRINPGSSIRLVSDDSISNSNLPYIRLTDFRRGLQTFSPWLTEDPKYFKSLNSSITIVDSYGFQWLLADSSIVPKTEGPVIACGTAKRIGEIWIFTAKTIHSVKVE
jgi:hypothetical protein